MLPELKINRFLKEFIGFLCPGGCLGPVHKTGWLAGWLAGWAGLAGWLAGWLAYKVPYAACLPDSVPLGRGPAGCGAAANKH